MIQTPLFYMHIIRLFLATILFIGLTDAHAKHTMGLDNSAIEMETMGLEDHFEQEKENSDNDFEEDDASSSFVLRGADDIEVYCSIKKNEDAILCFMGVLLPPPEL